MVLSSATVGCSAKTGSAVAEPSFLTRWHPRGPGYAPDEARQPRPLDFPIAIKLLREMFPDFVIMPSSSTFLLSRGPVTGAEFNIGYDQALKKVRRNGRLGVRGL